MTAATAQALRARLAGHEYGFQKGLILSHLIGVALFVHFALDRVIPDLVVGFYPTDIAWRLIAVWLVLDRNWRISRYRMGLWDWIYLVFILITMVGMIYNTTLPQLPITYFGYRTWAAQVASYLLVFLVVREACVRNGFRPDISIKWLMVAFGLSAGIGILQGIDFPGFREFSWKVYNQRFFEGMSQPNQARGTADHANACAFEMLVAMIIVLGQMLRRKPKVYEFVLVGLFGGCLIATQSRGGLIAFFALCAGIIIYMMWNRRIWAGTTMLAVTASLLVAGLAVVEIYNIEKFKRVLYGERVKSNVGLGSFMDRLEGRQHALKLINAFPVFGTGPNSLLYYNPRYLYGSKYGTGKVVDGVYWRLWADTGIAGLLFAACLIAYLLSHVRRDLAHKPFTLTVFLFGVVIATHGIAENFILTRGFYAVQVIVALSVIPLIRTERGRLLPEPAGSPVRPTVRPALPAPAGQ